jgi:hypothetical protein
VRVGPHGSRIGSDDENISVGRCVAGFFDAYSAFAASALAKVWAALIEREYGDFGPARRAVCREDCTEE